MKFYDLGDQSFETDYRYFRNNWVLQATDNGTVSSFGLVSLPFSKVTVESIFESTSIFEFVVQREPFRSNLLTCYCFPAESWSCPGINDGNRSLTQIIKRSDSKTAIRQTLISSLPQSLLQQSTL